LIVCSEKSSPYSTIPGVSPNPEGNPTLPPTREQLQVATDALRTEAGVWDAQSAKMGEIVTKSADLRLSRIEAGIFQIIVGPYDAATDQVTNRCREGQQRMTEVATTLRQVADTYDAEEARNEHRLRNLY
jgi:hypothetical protein